MIAVGASRETWTDGVATLRRRLFDAGYTQAGLERLLGRGSVEERTARAALSDDPLATLALLFAIGSAVSEGSVADALAPVELGDLVESGLLECEAGEVRACFRLAEYEGLIMAGDYDGPLPAPDHVLGLSGSTRLAASLTVRRQVERALDLGTGGGVQALLAASHAGHVVGTDVNARALKVARLNAALNGVANVEWREGSFFEPVHDERFGLVVSNPPFMITPAQELLFRDGGGQRDEVSERVVVGAASLLEEGGFATVVCNWITPAEGDWYEPPRRWTADIGCDALLLKLTTETPLAYAASECTRRPEDDSYTAAVSRWLEHYRRLGIESITTGAIVLRRCSGVNWARSGRDAADPDPIGRRAARADLRRARLPRRPRG
ncbi:MAG TPA: methyltransferase [Gaiellaceae bacterium]|nr:methyltransferase [Gaiellaceae bacterium]